MSEDIALRNLVADVAAAYFRSSHVTPSEIPKVINQIAARLSAMGAPAFGPPPETPQQPKLSPAQIRKSITRDALISFEDNQPYRTLRRHLSVRGMSPEEYRCKWGLPADYPMVAPSYREARSSLAKAHGFGARATVIIASPEPASPEPASPEPASPEPASSEPVSPESVSNTAVAEPVGPPVAASAAPKEGRSIPPRPPMTASTPSVFRPVESIRDLEARTRHKRWLSMLSKTDWARIRAIARQVNPAHVPAALTDLTAPLRVRACLVGHVARFPEEHVGTLRGGQVAVLISERGDH